MKVYVISSLSNSRVQEVSAAIRKQGHEVFDDWLAAGPEADDYWKTYEEARGHTFIQALSGHAARHVFEYDFHHLAEADIVVLVAPAGKSAFLELGWALGAGRTGYILLEEESERWDVMFKFADGVFDNLEDLLAKL